MNSMSEYAGGQWRQIRSEWVIYDLAVVKPGIPVLAAKQLFKLPEKR